jgi:hypothetical protein
MRLSHVATGSVDVTSRLIIGLLSSSPAGLIVAGAPEVGSGPVISGVRTGRPAGTGRWGR